MGGGEERRLTTCHGLDDGPDYTPDGAFIYYNSFCSGKMEIWRMHSDGSGASRSRTMPTPTGSHTRRPTGAGWCTSRTSKTSRGTSVGKQVKLRLIDTRE